MRCGFGETDFMAQPDISVDYAVMEKADKIARMVPASFGWSDVGNRMRGGGAAHGPMSTVIVWWAQARRKWLKPLTPILKPTATQKK